MHNTKTLLVWPWKASNLEYHSVIDTFVNGAPPSEPRCILPDSCFPDPNDTVKPPEPSVELRGQSVDLNVIFVAGTGLEDSDPNKARIDRSRVTLSVSSSTVDAIVALVLPDEKLEHLILMFAKGLEDVPTFFVCLDDPAFTKGLAIQKRAMVALSNYGSNWQFKHLSSTASASDVGSLFSDILGTVCPPTTTTTTTTTTSASKISSTGGGGGGRERRGCTLL